jgi:hypothetical protein
MVPSIALTIQLIVPLIFIHTPAFSFKLSSLQLQRLVGGMTFQNASDRVIRRIEKRRHAFQETVQVEVCGVNEFHVSWPCINDDTAV